MKHPFLSPLEVVVGLAFDENGHVLVARRPQHLSGGGFWEFPGGKLEPNESIFDALVREFEEEVGLKIKDAEPFLSLPYITETKNLRLHILKISSFSGKAHGLEGQPIKWLSPAELLNIEMLPANAVIIQALLQD